MLERLVNEEAQLIFLIILQSIIASRVLNEVQLFQFTAPRSITSVNDAYRCEVAV